MPKEYALCVIELPEYGGYSLWGLYSKGHHAPEDFACAAWDGCRKALPEGVDQQTIEKSTQQKWARWRPAVEYGEPHDMVLEIAHKPGRGAFPITYIEL